MTYITLTFFALLLCIAGVEAAGTGTVTGKVKLPEIAKNKRIAVEKYARSISGNVAPPPPIIAGVWLTGNGLGAPKNPRRVTLDQKKYQFGKSLVIVPLGTSIIFPNMDNDYHNIYSLSRPARFDLGRYKKGEKPAPIVVFKKTGLIQLNCEIHEHMRAHVLVVDSNHYAATDAKGNFKLSGVPPGNYKLHAQIDRKNKWTATVTVSSGKTTVAQFERSK